MYTASIHPYGFNPLYNYSSVFFIRTDQRSAAAFVALLRLAAVTKEAHMGASLSWSEVSNTGRRQEEQRTPTCLDGPERRLVEPPEQRLQAAPSCTARARRRDGPLRLVRRRRPAGEKQQRDEERKARRRRAGRHDQCGVLTGSRNLLMQGRFWSSPLLRFSFSQASGGEEYIGRPMAAASFGARRPLARSLALPAMGVGAATAPAAQACSTN